MGRPPDGIKIGLPRGEVSCVSQNAHAYVAAALKYAVHNVNWKRRNWKLERENNKVQCAHSKYISVIVRSPLRHYPWNIKYGGTLWHRHLTGTCACVTWMHISAQHRSCVEALLETLELLLYIQQMHVFQLTGSSTGPHVLGACTSQCSKGLRCDGGGILLTRQRNITQCYLINRLR